MGISIWLVPSTQDALKLKTIMRNRDRPSCSPSSYPEFHPHITLASFPSSSVKSISDLRSAIPPNHGSFSVEFESIIIGSHYFRSVYIAVKHTPSLRALHEYIHTKVGKEPDTPAFPHLSLCYIDDEDARNGERQRFFRDLDHDAGAGIQKGGQGVSLRYGERGEDDRIWGFEASEVWITNCDAPVDQWTVLDKTSVGHLGNLSSYYTPLALSRTPPMSVLHLDADRLYKSSHGNTAALLYETVKVESSDTPELQYDIQSWSSHSIARSCVLE